jgi:zinc transport system ATP-binding protein
MGISHIRNKAIGELSGGQMQRTFLCRALMNQPELLVLDEPSTYVDNNFEGELYLKLKELNEQMAILLISHDVGTISFFVKTIACVNRSLHHHPSNIITEEQLASYNCPLQIITHGNIPHTVLKLHDEHNHHGHNH